METRVIQQQRRVFQNYKEIESLSELRIRKFGDKSRASQKNNKIQLADIWDSNQSGMMVTKHRVQFTLVPSKQDDGDQTPCSTRHGTVKAGMLQHIQHTAEIQLADIWDSNQSGMRVTKFNSPWCRPRRLDMLQYIQHTAEIQIADIRDPNQSRMMVTKHRVQITLVPSKQVWEKSVRQNSLMGPPKRDPNRRHLRSEPKQDDGDQTPCSTHYGAVKAVRRAPAHSTYYRDPTRRPAEPASKLNDRDQTPSLTHPGAIQEGMVRHIQHTAESQLAEIWYQRYVVQTHKLNCLSSDSLRAIRGTQIPSLEGEDDGPNLNTQVGNESSECSRPQSQHSNSEHRNRKGASTTTCQSSPGSMDITDHATDLPIRQPVISAEDEKKERRKQQQREYYAQNATRIREQSRVKMAEKRRAASAVVCCSKNETSQIGHAATSEFVQRGIGCIASAHLHATTQKSELRHNTNVSGWQNKCAQTSNIAGDIDDEIAVDREIACLVEQAHQETTSSSESESSGDGNDKRRPTTTIGSGDASCSEHQDQTSAGVNGSNEWRPSLRFRLPSPAPNSPSPSPKGRMPSLYDSLW
ncbi:hypothetical protein C8R45DRAFT_928816 [Mycena sanguinolenta]|nr:hypothetical protein C8R45DRAFT_928816 [Mycena sanguinolenta]